MYFGQLMVWDVPSLHFLVIFVLVFLFAILTIILVKNRAQMFSALNIEDKEVHELKEKVRSLENYAKDLENKLRSMELLVNTLIDRITEVNARQLEPLKAEIKTLRTPAKVPSRPVLLVYGTDDFGEQDRNALRKAGVSFFRIKNANLEDLRMELHRRRSDGNLYDIVHISSHGGGDAVLLDTDLVDRFELSKILDGVRGIFLATCSNQSVSDKLLGIVRYVIMVYEEIDSAYLSNFVYEFYKRYKVDWDIEASFNGALMVMPEISEFVDLRIGGSNEL